MVRIRAWRAWSVDGRIPATRYLYENSNVKKALQKVRMSSLCRLAQVPEQAHSVLKVPHVTVSPPEQ